jgi:hypothetical protein
MLIELGVGLGFLGLQYVYHRWIEDKPVTKEKPQEISLPRVDEGSNVSLIYGRCRVRAPILAWHDTPTREDGDPFGNGYPTGTYVYQMHMFFVLGIGMADGDGESAVHGMWAGEKKFSGVWGAKETSIPAELQVSSGVDVGPIGSLAYYYDGNPLQDPGGDLLGTRQIAAGVDVFHIPGYYGYVSVLLYNNIGGWYCGSRPNIPQYSFEVSSYSTGHAQLGTYARVGSESNPVNVIHDLLCSHFGKLGLSESLIDMTSFQAAQYTLHTESHGYSRAIEEASDADGLIMEILKQIDGVLRFNPVTNKIEIKLVRNDYDPTTIPHITKSNCVRLESFAMGGRTNLVNRVRVVYPNRDNDYADDSEVARNQANAAHDVVNEMVIEMPGVCTQPLAATIAGRELAARSRPIMKFRAIVSRSFVRVLQGDAVKVTWTNPDLAGVIMRVANVEHGTLEDGAIALDLIQDYFYVHRNQTPRPPFNDGIDTLGGASGGGGLM